VRVRSLGFATDLAVLRAAGSTVVDTDDHLVVRTPSNPGYWWGNFVLVAGPDLVARGARRFRAAFPGAGHVAVGVDGTDGLVPPTLARLGLQAEVCAVLTAQAVAPPAGVDAEVRPLSAQGDWEQLLELRRQDEHPTDDGAYQRRRVADSRRLVETGVGVFLGAFRDGRLVSTLGVVSDGSGSVRYQHVQTHPEHRRHGLAGHLVAIAAGIAVGRWDVERFVIVADPDGPAINLYRSLGFHDTELQVQLARPPQPPATD
jgi:ribosomal protein S18 acetylase RimI-like enzyme